MDLLPPPPPNSRTPIPDTGGQVQPAPLTGGGLSAAIKAGGADSGAPPLTPIPPPRHSLRVGGFQMGVVSLWRGDKSRAGTVPHPTPAPRPQSGRIRHPGRGGPAGGAQRVAARGEQLLGWPRNPRGGAERMGRSRRVLTVTSRSPRRKVRARGSNRAFPSSLLLPHRPAVAMSPVPPPRPWLVTSAAVGSAALNRHRLEGMGKEAGGVALVG